MRSSGGSSSQQGGLFAPSTTGTTVSSLFGNASPPSSSLFGSQKLAGSSLFQSSSPLQPTSGSALFGQPTQSLFGDAPSKQTLTSTTTIEQQGLINPTKAATLTSQQQSSGLGSGTAAALASSGQLTDKETIENFKLDKFILGQIPEHAPPDSLCN